MRRLFTLVLAAAFGAAFLPNVRAQEDMPPIGDTVFDEVLTTPNVALGPSQCETGRGSTTFTTEGSLMRVRGRCFPTSSLASMGTVLNYIGALDGEVRADVKLVSGGNRANFYFSTRSDDRQLNNYYVMMTPATGQVLIGRNQDGRGTTLAQRRGADIPFREGDWNSFAVRMSGPRMWLIVNDETVLSVDDGGADERGLRLNVSRNGNADDDDEVAFLVRNLRISTLQGGDVARAPTYSPPLSSVPAGLVPPSVGQAILEDPLTGGGPIPRGQCPTGRVLSETIGEGQIIKVRGKCREEQPSAFGQTGIPNLLLTDGEVRVDVKFASGVDRGAFYLYLGAPAPGASFDAHALGFVPAQGRALISRIADGISTPLADRRDMASLVSWTDWNSIAVRADGTNLWLLLNDTPILWAEDAQFASGNVLLRLARTGSATDEAETAVVLRDLRVSALQDSPADRTPTYQMP